MKTLIKPLNECQTRKSDKGNGYYIVSETWGTCFHRISTTKNFFEITHNSQPVNFHTYTKVPASLADRTFHVYANPHISNNLLIHMPKGGRIVGMYYPQLSGEYLNYSFLIYCPTGEAPEVEEYYVDDMQAFTFIKTKFGNPVKFGKEQMFANPQHYTNGQEVIRLRPNSEGFILTKYNYQD